jgi:putative ABC transport system substrate-binding protein
MTVKPMQRRDFITLLGGAAAMSSSLWPLAARAQQPNRIKRVGVLTGQTEADARANLRSLQQALQELGWTERRNFLIDLRAVGSNDPDVARPYAMELVRLAPDVIVVNPAPLAEVLHRLTSTIPVVFNISGDPVQAGFVQSLARPGGNMTGLFLFEPSFNTKYLQLLKDMAPHLTRVAVLQTEASSWRGDFAAVEAVARSFSVAPIALLIRDDPADIERVIAEFAREPNGGLILPPDAITNKHRQLIVFFAAKHHLPAVYSTRAFLDAGGLMYYGAVPFDAYRRMAPYVDRILRGTKPSDLPVQAPTQFKLVINLRARARSPRSYRPQSGPRSGLRWPCGAATGGPTDRIRREISGGGQAFNTPDALAMWVAIASIRAGDRQS